MTQRTRLGAALLLLATGCLFHFDRSLSPGEIRGVAVVAGSSKGTTLPVIGALAKLENSSLQVTADKHGNFVFTQLPAGTYGLDVTNGMSGAGELGIHLSGLSLASVSGGLGNGLDLGQITLGALGGIKGQVIKNGGPVTGAVAALPGLAQTNTSDGSYSFSNLLPGDYTITIFQPTGPGQGALAPPVSVHVPPGQIATAPTVDLTNAPVYTQGAIDGVARLLGASSSAGVVISLSGISMTAATDSTGKYSESSIPAAVYTLTASANGFLPATIPAVIAAGPTTELPIITLTAGTAPPTPDAGVPDAGPPGLDAGVLQQDEPYSLGETFSAHSESYHVVGIANRAQSAEQSEHYKFVPSGVAATAGGAPP
jgi:uncharacterized protein (DUF2141 family)